MSPEKQRITIAEYCEKLNYVCGCASGMHDDESVNIDECPNKKAMFPNYLGDLNAMAEAEKKLVDYGTRALYLNNIYGIMGRDKTGRMFDESIGGGIDCVPFSTAVQRAEAFLRTIGKWQEQYVKDN